MNAAEYIGKEPQFLEARRKTLYTEDPPSKQFVKWTKLMEEQQRQTKPPLKQRKGKEKEGRAPERVRLQRACPRF